MLKAVSVTCAAFVLLAPVAGAQEMRSAAAPTVEAARLAAVEQTASQSLPAPAAIDAPALATPPRLEALEARRMQGRSITRSVLHTVGGAFVGAFVGYFTSQVVRSDWDKKTDAEVTGHRTSYALGGAVAGSLGGLLIGTRTSSQGVVAVPIRTAAQEIITQEQIAASGFGNVYELVQALHPEWLRTRGVKSMTEGARGSGGGTTMSVQYTPGMAAILVYLDNARMGNIESLRQLPTANVGAVRFLDSTEATYKWGIGHQHGVIWVTTQQ